MPDGSASLKTSAAAGKFPAGRGGRGLPADLRQAMAAIEASGGHGGGRCLSTGIGPVDASLPGRGLALAAVHEVQGPAAAGFALHLLTSGLSDEDCILWCVPEGRRDHLYGPGLWQAGIDPRRLVAVVCRDREEMLWTVEEALKSGSVAAVVAQMDKDRVRGSTGKPVDLTASRRLQLAAEAGGGLGLILSEGGGTLSPSAAATRWRIDPAPLDQAGDRACWEISLLRVRGGAAPAAAWRVRVDRTGQVSV